MPKEILLMLFSYGGTNTKHTQNALPTLTNIYGSNGCYRMYSISMWLNFSFMAFLRSKL